MRFNKEATDDKEFNRFVFFSHIAVLSFFLIILFVGYLISNQSTFKQFTPSDFQQNEEIITYETQTLLK